MATQLQDAKITVRINTEEAEKSLSDLEQRVRKDGEDIRKQVGIEGGTTRAQREAQQKADAKGGPAAKKATGPKLPGLSLSAPDLEKLSIDLVKHGVGAGIAAVPFLGPPAAGLFKAGVSAAIPMLEYGAPFAASVAMETLKELPAFGRLPERAKELATRDLEENVSALAHQVAELRAKQAGLNAMFEGSGDIIRTQLGVGVPLDADFLVQNAKDQFKIGEAKALLGKEMRQAVNNMMGRALGETIRSGMGG
tara:strand:- start:1688 stop:2443 length:756 start_codon:yes stop_codon:yes gene_type:complete